MKRSFWKDKRVFLTGHTGFKGSWMSLWLQAMDAKVCGYALAPETDPNLFELAKLAEHMQSHIADIRDFRKVEAAICDFAPDIIVHMAAQPLVRRSYREPLETLDTNIMGTAHVLQAARKVENLQAALIVTSDKCYQNHEREQGYAEHEAMGGHDPYSASKGCAELITSAFRNSFFAKADTTSAVIASARAGNVFGGGDWSEDRLIPDAVRAVHANSTLEIRHPQAVRPWQFVLEPLRGYLMLVEAMCEHGRDFEGGWNFGPGQADEVSVQEVLEQLSKAFGNSLQWQADKKETPHEAGLLRLNTQKSQQQLGWHPVWNLSQGLEETANWHQQIAENPAAARDLSLATLERYESAARASIRSVANL